MRSVYLAASYHRRDELIGYKEELEATGNFSVTSRWLNGLAADEGAATRGQKNLWARHCWMDLARANLLITFTEAPSSTAIRGGRHVELGLFLGMHGHLKAAPHVVVVGPLENVFYCLLPQVLAVQNWIQCVEAISPQSE